MARTCGTRHPPTGSARPSPTPRGRYGLAWQVDLKAGWSYGIAPGAVTTVGAYQLRGGDPARVGRMPAWFAREILRATTAPAQAAVPPPPLRPAGAGPAAYLATVIDRGAAKIATLADGRKRALSALAYQTGGLLAWSGLDRENIVGQLADVGAAAGLTPGISARIVNRAVTNGIARPITPPGLRDSYMV